MVIVTGNFEQQEDAARAMIALAASGFAADLSTRFFLNPPGIDGAAAVIPPTEKAHVDTASTGALSGAAIGGVIGGAIGVVGIAALGPAAPLAGAGVGAYVGSLAGAMTNIASQNTPQTEAGVEELPHRAPPRKAGSLVAVVAETRALQEQAIAILDSNGATDIDQCEGTIEGGLWTDFDRQRPLNRVPPQTLAATVSTAEGKPRS